MLKGKVLACALWCTHVAFQIDPRWDGVDLAQMFAGMCWALGTVAWLQTPPPSGPEGRG